MHDDLHDDPARLETAMRESEAHAWALVSVLPGSAVFIVDHTMRYRLAHGESLRDAGFASEQFVGRTPEEALGPALAAEHLPNYRRVLGGEPFEAEHAAHGRTFLTRGTPLRDGTGRVTAALVISVDVTAQHAARAALRESEARQAFLLELSDALRAEPDADAVANRALRMLSEALRLDRCYVGVYRLAEDRADFTHQVGNGRVPPLPAGVRLSDFPEALRVAFGRTLVIGDVAETQGLLDGDRQNLGALGLRALVAATLRRGEGHPLWAIVAVSAHPRHWTRGEVALVEEVTERTWAAMERARADAALWASEARHRALFEATDEGVCLFERLPPRADGRRDYRYLAMNRAMQALFGIPDLSGQSIRDHFPHEAESWYDDYDRVLETGEPIRFERASDPQGMVLEMFVTRLEDGTGRRLLAVMRDVTARRRAEEERARLLREAQDANRAKGEFLAVMSHELRTPLNAIGGYAELMEMGLRGPVELGIHGPVTDAQRQALARIQASQRHLLGLVAGVLNYSRMEAGAVTYHLVDVPVVEAVAEAEALVAPQLRARGLGYAWSGAEPGLAVRADREKLQQILLNLLGNAVKFTEPGSDGGRGRIEVSCTVAAHADGGAPRVCLHVRDTGVGIAPDKRQRIFEPFVQGDQRFTRTHEGVGLGLAISRDLARGMGGDLTVESEPGAGSVFTLTLPPAERPDFPA